MLTDHMDRGVQVAVEDGHFVITHVEGKLRLFYDDMLELGKLIEQHVGFISILNRHLPKETPPETGE